MNKRLVVVVLAALLAGGLGGAVLFAVFGDDDDGGEVAGPAATTTTTAPLNAVAQELVDRLADARQRDLHLVYAGAPPVGEEGKLTVEVWWKGDKARQSLVAEAPGRRQQSTAFVLDGGNVFCQRTDTTPWACQKGASTATAEGASAGIIDALVSSLEGKDVTSEEVKVGDVDAECYTLDTTTGDLLCLRGDDVPVKFTFSGAELTLVTAETKVDDDAFEPPAEVQSGVGSSTTATTGG